MKSVIDQIQDKYRKPAVVDVRSGDTVRVHQRIKEGSKERVQMFEGVVLRTDRKGSLTYRITVRKVASGIGVEKGFMMHAPNIEKVEVVKRSKVRRNNLSYLRTLTGKSARLAAAEFDMDLVNTLPEESKAEEKSDADVEAAPETPAAKPEADTPAEEKTEAKEA